MSAGSGGPFSPPGLKAEVRTGSKLVLKSLQYKRADGQPFSAGLASPAYRGIRQGFWEVPQPRATSLNRDQYDSIVDAELLENEIVGVDQVQMVFIENGLGKIPEVEGDDRIGSRDDGRRQNMAVIFVGKR